MPFYKKRTLRLREDQGLAQSHTELNFSPRGKHSTESGSKEIWLPIPNSDPDWLCDLRT